MITSEQRERRRQFIGSSDAAPLLGIPSFAGVSATGVYWDKVGPWAPDVNTASFSAGNYLEPVICAYAADRLKVTLVPSVEIVRPELHIGANYDALFEGDDENAVEAKYSAEPERWGEEGTDQIPEHVIVQCNHQMAVKPTLKRVWVPALVMDRNAEFRLYCVPRNESIIDTILTTFPKWWADHVEARVPPDGVDVAPLAALKALRREPESMVVLGDDAVATVARLEAAKAAAKAADAEKDAAQAAVLALLGAAEGAMLPNGRQLTYLAQRSGPRCDAARLRSVHPDIFETFFSQGSHRVLRIKEAARKAA